MEATGIYRGLTPIRPCPRPATCVIKGCGGKCVDTATPAARPAAASPGCQSTAFPKTCFTLGYCPLKCAHKGPAEVPKVQSTAPSDRCPECGTSETGLCEVHRAALDPLTVAFKADDGKARVSLIPPSALLALARVMTFGAKKYADHNFRKGFDYSRLLDAAQRHMLAVQGGEDRDPETGEYHMAHAMFCMAVLIEHMELGLGNDDRWKGPVCKS